MSPLKVLLLLDPIFEKLVVLLHVVADHPLTLRREDFKEVRELSDIEFQR